MIGGNPHILCTLFLTLFAFIASAWGEDPAVRIGNPLLARYPVSGDARPRSIWDLHTFNSKIYLAHGDYWNDSGPTDIWIYPGDGTTFMKEFVTDEEMIWDFFEYEGLLFIPGVDAMESWDYANLYINDPAQTNQAGWTKKRTLPNGRHSFEVALFKSNLYASITRSDYTGRTLVSTNMGSTWSTLLSQHSQYVVFDDFLFIEGDTDYIYDGQTLTTVTPNLIAYTLNTTRKVRYRDGVLYSLFPRYQLNTSPLYFITADQIENSGTATALPQFLTEKVRDIVVRSNVCYVMTVEEIQTDLLYRGQIYASSDLTNWPMATEFTVPGMPLSFEIMSNRFYVGLGSRFDGADWSRLTGPEAGSVWQVSPQPRLDYLDALTPGEVSLLVSLVPGFDFTLQSTPDLVSPLWSVVTATNALTDTYLITDPVLTNEAIRYYQITY